MESWGRGTLEIIELCRRDGHPEPNFLEDRGGFIVQMNSKYPLNTVIAADYDSVEEDVTAREKIIMVALKSALHGLSSSLISKKVDIPERTIRRDLSKLEERGLVKSEGKGRARKWLAYKDNPAKSGQTQVKLY